MYIIGLNLYHGDASACLFKDGKLIFAAEEERYTRIKHSAGFPINALKNALENQKITIDEIDYITINRNPKKRVFDKIFYAIKNPMRIKNFSDRVKNFKNITSLEKKIAKEFNIGANKLKNKIINFDHHLSHAASSVLASNYKETNFVTLDGFGDFLSTTVGSYAENKFYTYKEVKFPHSLGIFYTAITQLLGFKNYGDEYKVMGLASYGSPRYLDKMRDILKFDEKNLFELNLDLFLHHSEGLEMSWLEGEPKVSNVYNNNLIKLLGEERQSNQIITDEHKDIAASAQKLYEEILFKILDYSYRQNKSDNLCLSGGCAMNSVANGKIILNTNYKNIYINHSPGDSGGSIGSALLQLLEKQIEIDVRSINTPYLGNKYNNEEINKIIYKNEKLKENRFSIKKYVDQDLFKKIAFEISKEKIVGFFSGSMEFGSRALGSRSIIADPRNPNIRELLNLKIKRRESFRPFAPSILEEHTEKWFKINDKVPFMSKVYKVKKEKRDLIPAVVHIDGTGRLQTVNKDISNRFYSVIDEFFKITGIPLILNTSFNENEPIVCKPEEAIECFLRTNMDILILQNYVIER